MASGLKSLIQVVQALEALHGQLLNLPDASQQKIEVYGIMVPRWAAEPGTSEADVRDLEKKVYGRRRAQDVRIVDAIKVVRELVKEHSMSQDFPASSLGG